MPHRDTILLALALLLLSPAARADAPDLPSQLALDVTPVPDGMGALFVPSSTRPELEPLVHVYRDDERIATGPVAKRMPLPPGRYTVLAGQGPVDWRASVDVEVVAGETVTPPAFFGTVRVLAIDPYDRTVPTSYCIVSADGARRYGPERTSDSPAYRDTRTWVLAPGNYYLVPGTDPDRQSGRIPLPVSAGSHHSFRLVLEGDSVVRTEFSDRPLEASDSIWRLDWTLGGSFALNRATNQLNGFSGDALRLGAFTRLEAGIDAGDHLGLLKVAIDQDWVGLEHSFGRGLPTQKLTDLVAIDLLYNYRLGEVVGPYVRAQVRTSLFETKLFPEDNASVDVQRTDGTIDQFTVDGTDEIRLMPGLAPTIFQESAGIGVTALNTDALTVSLRGGVAARQQLYGANGRFLSSHSPGQILLKQLDDISMLGVEATVAFRLAISDVLSVQSSFDAFSAFDEFGGGASFKPAFFWDTTATLQLNRWAMLVYQLVVHRDDRRLDDIQMRQSLNLRFQYAIF